MEQPNPAEGTRAKIFHLNIGISWAVVVVQLVEQLPLIPEVCSSNPVIGKNLCWTFTGNCIEKTKMAN